MGVAILVTIGVGLLSGSADPIFGHSAETTTAESNEAYFEFFWMTIFVLAAYGAVAEMTLRRTLGKFVSGLETVSLNDDQVTRDRALMRNAAKLASIYLFGVGIAWALIDRRNRMWHDLMSGTYVADARAAQADAQSS